MELYKLKQEFNSKTNIFIVTVYDKTKYTKRYNAQWFENGRLVNTWDYEVYDGNPIEAVKRLIQGKINEYNNVAKVYVKTHRQRKDVDELTLDKTERKYSSMRDEYIDLKNNIDEKLIQSIEL